MILVLILDPHQQELLGKEKSYLSVIWYFQTLRLDIQGDHSTVHSDQAFLQWPM